jgi:hypothetical protein
MAPSVDTLLESKAYTGVSRVEATAGDPVVRDIFASDHILKGLVHGMWLF